MQKQIFFQKIFSQERMQRYFDEHRGNPEQAILHYQCNIELTQAFYTSVSVFEIALRNALCRELIALTGRNDWYKPLSKKPELNGLRKYFRQAEKQIKKRGEVVSCEKMVAELTLGFWVSLLNSQYEKVLWKKLRHAFPYMPVQNRQRKNVTTPLNSLRTFRNRIFHHEPICWDMNAAREMHNRLMTVIEWINRDVANWVSAFDQFENAVRSIEQKLN